MGWVIITMAMVDVDDSCQFSADSQPKSTGLVWGLAATRRSVYIHQMNLENSCNDFGHDDSTINIVMAIINSKRGSCYDQKAVTIFAVSMAHLSTRSHSYLGISPAQILFHAPPNCNSGSNNTTRPCDQCTWTKSAPVTVSLLQFNQSTFGVGRHNIRWHQVLVGGRSLLAGKCDVRVEKTAQHTAQHTLHNFHNNTIASNM